MKGIPTTRKIDGFSPVIGMATRLSAIPTLLFLLLLYGHPLGAEGIPELKPSNDQVRLIINRTADDGGGRTNFAGWDNDDPFSRLYINIQDPSKEYIYIGLGLSDLGAQTDINPDFNGTAIRYRVIAPDGTVVVNRIVDLADLNIAGATDQEMYDNAKGGPSEITAIGYTAGSDFTISPTDFSNAGVGSLKGNYYIEFTEVDGDGNPTNPGRDNPGIWDGFELEFFDFTVADYTDSQNPVEKKGRVWSWRWELTTTSRNIPFNGAFYVCDNDESTNEPGEEHDAFVTKIDFNGVGFMPYAFNTFFNSSGVMNTGNPVIDRRSQMGENAQGTPEHMVFINDPVDVCMTASFGSPSLNVSLERCSETGPFTYCFLVNLDKEGGQLDILINLNGDPGYQSGTEDIIISKKVEADEEGVDTCIPWDGLDGLGGVVSPDDLTDANIFPMYMEGIFHFPIFDAETNSMSFNIDYIRPMPSGASTIKLKWDDSQITDVSINGSDASSPVSCEQVNLDGCSVDDSGCTRCWTKTGYGDRATLNTYWTSLTQPLNFTIVSTGYYTCDITGNNELCLGDATTLTAVLTLLPDGASAPDDNSLSFAWTGPDGIIVGANGPAINITDYDPATDAGTYTVTVGFGLECITTCSVVVGDSNNCEADLSLDKSVNDHTPDIGQTITFTIEVTNSGPSEATNVTVEDEIPDGYSLITVTDGIGVYDNGSGKITWNVASIPATGNNTVSLTYTAKVIGGTSYLNIAQVTASDQDDPDSDPDKDETEDDDGDGDDFDDDEDFEVVCPNATITITPESASICAGAEAILSVNTTNGGTGDCMVSWFSSTDNSTFAPTGATGDTYIVPNTLDEGIYYYKAVYSCDGEYCQDAESNVAVLTIEPDVSAAIENIIMGFDYATSETCENFDVIMDVEVCNEDPTQIENLTVVVDLESQSNGIFAGNAQIIGIVDGEDVTTSDIFNPDFDGDSDQNLFKPDAASLEGNSCLRVRIRFEIAPEEALSVELASTAEFVSTAGGASGCTATTFGDSVELGNCWYRSRVAAGNDNINVTVDADCKAIITPDMVLENHFYACDTWTYPLGGFYRLRILYPGEAEPRAPQPWAEVHASDFPNGMVIVYVENVGAECRPLWGKVTLEDKSAPYFECAPEDVTSISREEEVQTAEGLLKKDEGPLLNFHNYACFHDEVGTPDDCDSPYDVLEFYVSKPDIYTFEAWDPAGDNDQVENDNELLFALYVGDFDPSQPCSNIIGQSNTVAEYGVIENGEAPDGRIRFSSLLSPGTKYSLLVAHDDCEDNSDDYRVYALSDNGGVILDGDLDDSGAIDNDEPADNFSDPRTFMIEKELFCSDLDYILNNSDYTPNPIARDNCSENPQVWFDDILHDDQDCGEIYIERTWYIKDDMGNIGQSCTQYIHFRRPVLEDVQKPPTTVPIECDELGPEWLDEDGHPKPEIAGYPFVITAFGITDLNEVLCNIGADYRDISVINVCENTQKIVRQWIILDWCDISGQWELNNGTLINWRQIIKTGDFSAPEVTVDNPDSVIPGSGLGCEVDLLISDITVTDNCSASYTTIAKVYQILGNSEIKIYEGTTGDVVQDVELGNTYRIDYEVADDCGNKATTSYSVTVEDNVAPVAVCDDDFNITLGGDGIGRLMDTDVDEGSWDNCELKDIYISRKLATDDIRDAYLQEIYSLTFDDLELNVSLGDLDMNVDSDIWVKKSNGDQVLREKDGMWYTWWEDEIWFVCQDPAIPVVVELLAEDVEGLTNMCWLTVTIEDKLTPYCEAPAPVTELCTELPYGFDPQDDAQLADLFGMATGQGNCSDATASQTNKTVDWNCNSGTITRYFVAETAGGRTSTNTCKQLITITPAHDYELKFPKDVTVDCEVPDPDTLMYEINGCDLITVNVADELFNVISAGCYTLRRTYQVINWCEYNGDDDPVVVSRDHDCDGLTGSDNIYVLRRANGDVFFDYTNDETDSSPTAGSRGCSPNNPTGYWEKNAQFGQSVESTGYWEYIQYIKVEDNTPPGITIGGDDEFCIDNNVDCDGVVSIPFTATDLCPGSTTSVTAFIDGDEVTVTGTHPNYMVSGRYEPGEHQLEVRATDGCSPTASVTKTFTVIDCLAPSPICINGLAIGLMPSDPGADLDNDGIEDKGSFALWASDFKVSGLEDCSGTVTLSVNRLGETPVKGQGEIILTCADPDTLVVEIYAWDEADNPTAVQPDGTIGGSNYDHCITYIIVQDNMFNLCDDQVEPAVISGALMTPDDVPVEFADVFLTGGMTHDMKTNISGSYSFNDLTMGSDYTITPVRDDDHGNGVNTFDLIKVNKHILGSARFTDPYQLIAADVNQSNSVTALDMIHIRKLLLGNYTTFPGSRSWRFIAADYVFPDANNPWAEVFPEILNYNNVANLITSGDFIAVKIGDVNHNARPNSLYTVPRNVAGAFHLNVADQELKAGEEYHVNVTSKELDKVQGYQFSFNFDNTALELVDMEYGVAKAEHFGLSFIEEGVVTTSWNHDRQEIENQSVFATTDEKLFTLVFRAKKNAPLSDLLQVNSRYTFAEAYDLAGEPMDVKLIFGSDQGSEDSFELYQNLPNPWKDKTSIGFHLPEADKVTLTLYDVQGKVLKVTHADFGRGYNQIELKNTELRTMATGILYYRLETSQHSATRKMAVVE